MVPSRLKRPKCQICGVEVTPGVLDVHMRNQHPGYLSWGRRRRKWMWLVLGSGAALVLSDALFLPFLHQILQYVIPIYLLAAVYVLIMQQVRKQHEFRDAWRETHPFQSSQVNPEAGSDPGMTREPSAVSRWRRKTWLKVIFWVALVVFCTYLLFLLSLGGYPAPPP